MAPRKKSVQKPGRKNKVKFKTVSKVVSIVAAVRKKLNRAGKMVSRKVKRVITAFGRAVKSILCKYGNMPRALRIISVYLLVLLITGGIFAWRVAGLRSSKPDPAQWSFEFAEIPGDWEHYLQSGSTVDSDDGDTETIAGVPGEDEDIVEPVSEELIPEPTFQPGIWPVTGELLYGYDTVIREDTSASTTIKFSKGIAITADAGTVVHAVWDGTVVKTSQIDAPYGQSVTIKHDFGLVTFYGALGSVQVKEGDTVKQGEIIGTVAVGDGQAQSHLFLKIMENGDHVNPESKLLPR